MRRRGNFFGCRFAEICIVSAMMGALMILVLAPAIAVVPDPMLQYDPQRTGNVPGIAPGTGTLLWQSHDGTSGCIQSGPVVYGDKVFISTWFSFGENATDGLYCLDKWTGEEIWNNTGVSGASTAAIADGRLFLGTHNGYLASIDAVTGEILWREKIEESPAWSGVASSPLIYNDTVYALSFSTGTLHAFSFDGRELWNHSTGGSIFVYSSPAAYEGKIFFAGNTIDGQHGLYCIDMATRKVLWNFSVETEIRGSPTIGVEEGMVFFTTQPVWEKEHRLYAVNISTGEEVWNRTHFSSWASPALSHGRIFIGGSGAETTFFCFDARTGVLIWKNEEMGGAIDSSPVVADGKVFFGTQEVDGTVYALCADTGNTIWSYTRYTPEGFGGGFNVASHPAVVDGTLFIGMDNVGVLAFRDPEVLWEGEVTLVNDTTFEFTAANPPYNTYVINTTTCMGALYATDLSFNASDEWYADWGTFSIESIGGIVNEPWAPGARSWSIWLNGELAPTGLSGNDLVDGDNLKFYFLPWCGETFAPLRDQATYLVNIDVTILPVVPIWQGAVTLINDTTFEFTASNPPYNTYVINTTTCMGALYATGLSFNASDEWYADWGTFSIESIGGIVNEPWAPGARSWSIWLNGELAPTGLSGNDLVDGDNLKFYFLPWCGETFAPLRDQATYLVNIDVTILPVVPIFDTGAPDNPFPSIAGTHTGTIRPTYTVHATRLYTYAIEGTGGHTKFARIGIGNETWNITATWGGFVGDWRYITFDEPVILLAGKTYSFEIITGSYPQIHHTPALPTANGWINCTGFVDVNGREHQGWIPAIRLE